MKKLIYLFLFVVVTVAFNACHYTDIVPGPANNVEVPDDVSFADDIVPVFQEQSCTNCHPGMSQPDLSAGNAYGSLMDGGYIDTKDPEASILLIKAASDGSHAAKLTSAQEALIIAWIDQGADDN